MPKNLSAWKDLAVHLFILLVMIVILSQYDKYFAAMAMLAWVCLAIFAWDRSQHRVEKFREYCENVIGSGNEMMRYAVKNIPQAIFVIDEEGNVQWFNALAKNFTDKIPEQGMHMNECWAGILRDEIFTPELSTEEKIDDNDDVKGGSYTAHIVKQDTLEDGTEFTVSRYFKVRYRQLNLKAEYPRLITLFVQEVTQYENLKNELQQTRTVIMYLQVDNYDEIMQGLNEAEKNSLMLSVSEELEKWINDVQGFIQRVSNDLYVVIIQRSSLDKCVERKFAVLDKVRQIVSKNGIPVTLSIGAAVSEKRSENKSLTHLGEQAMERLVAALARGGDQAAVNIDGNLQYFGGRAKAVEKHNRVRARVTANSIREHMEMAEEIFVMGHVREDFDAFGAACGVAVMAMYIKKPVHVVLSNSVESIEKMLDQFRKDKSEMYDGLFVKAADVDFPTTLNPLLIVVDTHIPYLTAAPNLLERIKNVIVIDHHRRSDNGIKNPVLFYHEPSSSSASELVTELLMYFDEKVPIGKLPATALYSGIVVDTKSFVVQTGIRTFDAAAYLRRNGADPVVVRELFMSDYETTVALASAKAQSEYFEDGLVVATINKRIPNVQAIAGQAADSLLTIENVRMSIVLFLMQKGEVGDVIGISARSSGNLNVQVIMEKFGGGGHQNVAGAQVKDVNFEELKKTVTEVARNYIAETDKLNDDY